MDEGTNRRGGVAGVVAGWVGFGFFVLGTHPPVQPTGAHVPLPATHLQQQGSSTKKEASVEREGQALFLGDPLSGRRTAGRAQVRHGGLCLVFDRRRKSICDDNGMIFGFV
jgi:hypothetical protein